MAQLEALLGRLWFKRPTASKGIEYRLLVPLCFLVFSMRILEQSMLLILTYADSGDYYLANSYWSGLYVGLLAFLAPLSLWKEKLGRRKLLLWSALSYAGIATMAYVALSLVIALELYFNREPVYRVLFFGLGTVNWAMPLALASCFDITDAVSQAFSALLLMTCGYVLPVAVFSPVPLLLENDIYFLAYYASALLLVWLAIATCAAVMPESLGRPVAAVGRDSDFFSLPSEEMPSAEESSADTEVSEAGESEASTGGMDSVGGTLMEEEDREEEEEEYSIEDMLGLDIAAAHKPTDKSSRGWYLRPHAILCETRIWYFALALALVSELRLDIAPFIYDSWMAAYGTGSGPDEDDYPGIAICAVSASMVVAVATCMLVVAVGLVWTAPIKTLRRKVRWYLVARVGLAVACLGLLSAVAGLVLQLFVKGWTLYAALLSASLSVLVWPALFFVQVTLVVFMANSTFRDEGGMSMAIASACMGGCGGVFYTGGKLYYFLYGSSSWPYNLGLVVALSAIGLLLLIVTGVVEVAGYLTKYEDEAPRSRARVLETVDKPWYVSWCWTGCILDIGLILAIFVSAFIVFGLL